MKTHFLPGIPALFLLSFMTACGLLTDVSSQQETPTHQLTFRVAMTSSVAASQSLRREIVDLTESPSLATMKFFNIYLSKNADCSNPINIFRNNDGKILDITVDPVISVVDAPEGNYPCVMIEASDQLTFTAPATQGSCDAGASYHIDVCRAPERTQNAATGAVTDCGENQDDKVTIYISTQSVRSGTDSNSNTIWFPFLPPRFQGDDERGVILNNSVNVSQDITGTFLIDFTNKLDGSQNTCDLKPPSFGFVAQ